MPRPLLLHWCSIAGSLVLGCAAGVAHAQPSEDAPAGPGASREELAGQAPPPAEPAYPPPAVYPEPYVSPADGDPAQDPAEPYPEAPALIPGSRIHDGFFLRVSAGAGAGQMRYREQVAPARVSDVTASGLSGQLELALGGNLTEPLILHGNLLFTGFGSDTRRVDGVKDAAVEVSWNATMVGAGLTYYFLPLNVYLSGTAGLAWLTERRQDDAQVQSDSGFGGTLAVGKEWWVGYLGQWGVGAALRGLVFAAPIEIGRVRSTLRGGDIGLVFSATFN